MDITNMIKETKENGGNVYVMSDLHLLKKEKDRPRITLNKNYENAKKSVEFIGPNDMLIFMGDFVDDTIDITLFANELYTFFDRPMKYKIWIRGNNDIFSDNMYSEVGFKVCYSALYHTDEFDIVFSHTSFNVVDSQKIIYCVHGHMHRGDNSEMFYYHNPKCCVNLAQNNLANGYSIQLPSIEYICKNKPNQSRWFPGNEKPGMSQFIKNMAFAELMEDLNNRKEMNENA